MTETNCVQLDKLLSTSLTQTDTDILNALDSVSSSASEEWADMCSDIPVDDSEKTINRANEFLIENRSNFRVTEVDQYTNDDEYVWTFVLKV